MAEDFGRLPVRDNDDDDAGIDGVLHLCYLDLHDHNAKRFGTLLSHA